MVQRYWKSNQTANPLKWHGTFRMLSLHTFIYSHSFCQNSVSLKTWTQTRWITRAARGLLQRKIGQRNRINIINWWYWYKTAALKCFNYSIRKFWTKTYTFCGQNSKYLKTLWTASSRLVMIYWKTKRFF